MYEFAALIAGLGLGLGTIRIPARYAFSVTALGAIGVGIVVSGLSGELADSWGFAVFDAAQAGVAAVCIGAIARAVARRRAL